MGLYEDYDAIKAGVTLPWSTSPVEGHINRLKMVKRQMFGRAHLDLLSRRFLRAPRGDQVQGLGQQTPTQAPAVAAEPCAPPEVGRHHASWRPVAVSRQAGWSYRPGGVMY